MFKNVEDFQKFGKDQLDSVTESASSLTKGVQAIALEATDFSRKSLESSSALIEKLLGAKTLESAVQIQQDYAKSSYETLMAQATRFGELYTSLARDTFKPFEAAIVMTRSSAG